MIRSRTGYQQTGRSGNYWDVIKRETHRVLRDRFMRVQCASAPQKYARQKRISRRTNPVQRLHGNTYMRLPGDRAYIDKMIHVIDTFETSHAGSKTKKARAYVCIISGSFATRQQIIYLFFFFHAKPSCALYITGSSSIFDHFYKQKLFLLVIQSSIIIHLA